MGAVRVNLQRRVEEASAESYRLPMLVTELDVYKNLDSYYVCPRCRIPLEREFVAYCDRCGQCLNWAEYKKARLVFINAQAAQKGQLLI